MKARLLQLSPVLLGLILLAAPGRAAGPSPATRAKLAPIDSLWVGQQWGRATAMVDSLIPVARAAVDSSLLAHLLCRKGNFLVGRGAMADADEPLQEALRLAEALQDTAALCTSLRWLSMVSDQLGTRPETEAILDRMIRAAAASGDRTSEGWGHIGKAYQAWTYRESASALDHYARAADLFTGTADLQGFLWATNGLANLQADRGLYQDALATYAGILDQARLHGQPGTEAHALNNLGSMNHSLGRPDAALDYFRQALEVFRGMGRLQELPPPMHNIALCLEDLGRQEDAREILDEALRISEEVGAPALIVRSRQALAGNLFATGHLAEARGQFEEILAAPRGLDPLTRFDALRFLSIIATEQRRYDDALALLERAENEVRGGKHQIRTWQAVGMRGHNLRLAGRPREALEVNRRVVEACRREGLQAFLVDGLIDIALCHLDLDQPDGALVHFEAAAEEWEKERQLLLSPRWREERGNRGRRIFPELARLLWERGDRDAAWDRLQTYKARTLLERMLGPGRSFDEVMAAGNPEVVGLSEFRQSVLEPGDLMLDFALGDDRSLAVAVTRDTMALAVLPGAGEINSRVDAYHALLSDPGSADPAAIEVVSGRMVELALGELAGLIADRQRVLVSPDGALNLVPFGLLALPLAAGDADAAPAPLWNRVPSASILTRIRELENRNRGASDAGVWGILALAGELAEDGTPLPGTREEIRWLAGTFAGVETPPVGPETSEALLPLVEGMEILHIASHTAINDQSPWQSAVILGDGSEGGRWRAETIAGRPLDSRLVVLSSCSTARGRVLSGEGVMGLTGAFFSAGVPTVVSSLWPVDDGVTLDFMRVFYLALAEGQDVTRALASARSAIRNDSDTSHPYYWAGFVVSGEGTLAPRLDRRATRRHSYAVAAFLTVALALAVLGWRRRRAGNGSPRRS